MTPRRRLRKVGLGRVDAAIDAMAPLGFSREVVKRTVNKLLQVYDGDGGWVFIEEACYKLLIDTILEEQETSEQEKGPAEEEAREEDDHGQSSNSGPSSEVPNNVEPSDAGPVRGVQDVAMPSATGHAQGVLEHNCSTAELLSTEPQTNGKECLPSAEGEGRGWRDIILDKHSGSKLMDDEIDNSGGKYGVVNALIHLPEQVIPYKQLVDNSPKKSRRRCNGWIGSDDQYELLHSSSTMSPRQFNNMIDGKRKSRWDVRPEDP